VPLTRSEETKRLYRAESLDCKQRAQITDFIFERRVASTLAVEKRSVGHRVVAGGKVGGGGSNTRPNLGKYVPIGNTTIKRLEKNHIHSKV
jgi:hypothetical protein